MNSYKSRDKQIAKANATAQMLSKNGRTYNKIRRAVDTYNTKRDSMKQSQWNTLRDYDVSKRKLRQRYAVEKDSSKDSYFVRDYRIHKAQRQAELYKRFK